MTLVLQIVKDCDVWTPPEEGARESRVQQNIDLMFADYARETELLEQDARRPETSADTARRPRKVHSVGDNFTARFTIREDHVFIRGIDAGNRGQEIPQIDLSPADFSGDHVQGVHADAHVSLVAKQALSLRARRVFGVSTDLADRAPRRD